MSQLIDDDDPPPAGTACLPCKQQGRHYCPAKHYNGIGDPVCPSCLKEVECPALSARRIRHDFSFEPSVSEAPPVRIIPSEQFPQTIPPDPTPEIKRRNPLDPPKEPNMFQNTERNYEPNGDLALAADRDDLDLSDPPSTDADDSHPSDPIAVATINAWKPHVTARLISPTKIEQAVGMFKNGYGIKAVHRRTGLAVGTVRSIYRETPGLPPLPGGSLTDTRKSQRKDPMPSPKNSICPSEVKEEVATNNSEFNAIMPHVISMAKIEREDLEATIVRLNSELDAAIKRKAIVKKSLEALLELYPPHEEAIAGK